MGAEASEDVVKTPPYTTHRTPLHSSSSAACAVNKLLTESLSSSAVMKSLFALRMNVDLNECVEQTSPRGPDGYWL